MTELVECKRLEEKDEWFLAVQDEFRRGGLTERAHQFLHGKPTDVPGSWLNNQPMCGPQTCMQNVEAIAQDNELECGRCAEERKRRCL
eukprot:1233674-Pyramimonas_sp.AAC.1